MARGYSIITGMILIGIWFSGPGAERAFSLTDGVEGRMTKIPFVTADKGYRSGIKDRRFVVIKTEEEWEKLWTLHKATVLPAPSVPVVDFEREMIIAVFSGEKRTGGYGIEIRRIEENPEIGEVTVFYLETQPPPHSMVTQALAQPYHIVRLKKVDLPIAFLAELKVLK